MSQPGGVTSATDSGIFHFLGGIFANIAPPEGVNGSDGCWGGCASKERKYLPQWWPEWAQNAWLYYQWTCALGPAFAKDMTVEEIQEWQRTTPIYCIDRLSRMNEYVDDPADVELSSYVGIFGINIHSKDVFSYVMYSIYVSAYLNLDDLWPGHVSDWWDLMYADASTDYGRLTLQSRLYEMQRNGNEAPQSVQTILMNNYRADVQQQYCLLNEPDLSNPSVVQFISFKNRAKTNRLTGALFQSIANSKPRSRWGFPFWTADQRRIAFQTILPHIATLQDGQWSMRFAYLDRYLQVYIDNGWLTSSIKPPSTCPDGSTAVGDGSACESDANPGEYCSLWGTEYPPCNPSVYDPQKPPVKVVDPLSGKGGIDSGLTIPGYTGNLPSPPVSSLKGQTPWMPPSTDPEHGGYDVPCGGKSAPEEVAPIIGGVVGSLIPLMILPGKSRLAGAVTLGSFGYLYFQQTIGWDAFINTWFGKNLSGVDAALILSVGAPVTGALFVFDVGLDSLLPTSVNNEAALTVAAGAAGYLALDPILEPVLGIGGKALSLTTGFVDMFVRLGEGFTSGCVNHTLAPGCKCENAQSKPKLAESLVYDVYGATDDQATMRLQCLQSAMQEGEWGTDPVTIGSCQVDKKGVQSNPAACIIPEWWTPQNMDPSDELVSKMWGNIAPCLDPNNRSFLPPGYSRSATDPDAKPVFDSALEARDLACTKVNGPYSRSYITGCVDTSKIKAVKGR